MNIRLLPLIRLGACLALASGAAFAQAPVSVSNPWVRATVPGQQATGAFMQLRASENLSLVGAASPVAGVVEVHEMAMENGVMRMRHVSSLPLQAGQPVDLKPGSYHIMLMELKGPLAEGQTVPLTLTLETATRQRRQVQVEAPVKPLTAKAAH